MANLLANIGEVNFETVCTALGWKESTRCKEPSQKHIKVAIVNVLIETSKKNDCHLIHQSGFFYIYNSAYWQLLENSEVKHLLKKAAIKMGYAKIESKDSAFVENLFKQAKNDGFFEERNYARHSIINLQNGSLVLGEDCITLKPFDYRDFLTHQLDFAHDPRAVNTLFLKYLEEVLPDENTRLTLQQVAGYLFIKGLKMEKIIFLIGVGSNGKSVFFEVLSGVIGTENISNYSLEELTDDKGYHRAKIQDKIVNFGTDIRLTKFNAGMFKTLASGEPIGARLPHRHPFIMSDYAKLIFNVNQLDSANVEHTHGFFRRLLTIPFNKTIPDEQQDRDFHKKILLNRAGVLNWIIEGAEQVIKNRDIFVSDECNKFKEQFIKESDSVAMYEENWTTNMPGSNYSKKVSEAHQDFKEFCKDVIFKALGRNIFAKRMEALGFVKSKKEGGMFLEKRM